VTIFSAGKRISVPEGFPVPRPTEFCFHCQYESSISVKEGLTMTVRNYLSLY